MKRIHSTLSRALGRRIQPLSAQRKARFAVLALAALVCSLLVAVPTVFVASGSMQKGVIAPPAGGGGKSTELVPSWQQAVNFAETPALRDLRPAALTPEEAEKLESVREDREKNEQNTKSVKRVPDLTATRPFIDPAINNSKGAPETNLVTNPIQSFDGPDMDFVSTLFAGGRFAPPDTNAAVGPNHVVITTNSVVQVFSKAGVPAAPAVRISTLLAGISNAADDDGDPIVLYDQLADRWIISQFNLTVTTNSTHQHIAVSKTGDPTGAYFAYDFLMTASRPADYPHMGVWPDGYYMSTNDFSLPVFSNPFQGAGLYAFDRAKMLVGDPTAIVIRFNTNNTHGGMLPSNLQGFTPPPVGTPNLFGEFDAAIFGAPFDLVRFFAFHADFAVPGNSTLTQGPDIATAAFDARNPSGRADVQQPAPGEGLDSIADRLMHALNFRVLAGGVQSLVLNFTVNVSGVNPTTSATYQAGVRWMELRRNSGTGVVSINQQATYAPGSGSGTGRDLWMAGVAQDGEGNIALAANGTAPGPTPAALNPTIIYTGRLSGDPVNTLLQGEVDGMSAVTKGVQTATSNRWGDYSSLFVDPADECTFWGAFEYVDSPTASFDWNTRLISFKVNPTCVTAPRGTINGTITNCTTGQPILNAVITTPEGYARQSNAAGQFSMTVNPGTYTINVKGAPGTGLSTCTGTVTVAANGTSTFNCCLGASPIIVSAGATLVSESCTPANGVPDPNETVTISFCVQNTGSANTANLVGTLQATGGVVSPSGPQNYGVVVAGGPPVCRNFTFTVNGTCGGTITASIQLQDGATNLGTVTFTFTLGTLAVTLSENFDGVVAPALPAGWAATQGTNLTGAPLWVTSTTTPDTAPNDAFSTCPTNVLDNRLDTPTINITSAAAQLSFRNNWDFNDSGGNFDGGVLEISINGAAFTDIVAAGGSFVQNGYNGTISVNFASPIAGRQAWTAHPNPGYVTTIANLPPAANGQPVKLRFRAAADNSVVSNGWRIDTIQVSGGFACATACGGTPCVITCPANTTRSNDPNQCGAVVNYPAPTSSGTCGTITCTPPSGSFFPVGTTTVTCTASGGPSCTFTVTVNDTQPPTITCSCNLTAVTPTPNDPCVVVNFTTTASDNCPGVTVVCNPPSGSCFPLGTTTVTCTATDASGNTATCSFTVTVFNGRLQDDFEACNDTVLFNTITGAYRWCCHGTIFTGQGKITRAGDTIRLEHIAADRRVRIDLSAGSFPPSGNAGLQSPPGTIRCVLQDHDIRDDFCVCGAGGCQAVAPKPK